MQLVALVVERKLLPYVQYEIYGVGREVGVEAVCKPETVLLETEYVDFLVVEVSVQLHPHPGEAAAVKVVPYRSAYVGEAYVAEVVVDDELKVLVYRVNGNGVERRQHDRHYRLALMPGYGVPVESLLMGLVELLNRYHQYRRVNQHHCPLPPVAQQVYFLERLPKVGSRRYAAPHGVRLIGYAVRVVCVEGRERQRVFPYAYCQPRPPQNASRSGVARLCVGRRAVGLSCSTCWRVCRHVS